MSLTYIGILVGFLGTFLTTTFGLSEACSNEITSKITAWLPLVAGSGLSFFGRWRAGGINIFGLRK